MKMLCATILLLTSKIDKGWTLLEIISVGLIVGILAAIITPSMIALNHKNKVQSGLAQVKGALEQAQRNAIKMSKECRIAIQATNDSHNPPSITVYDQSYSGCLSQSVILDDLKLQENFSGSSIRFSYKGNPSVLGTIIVHSPYTNSKYCLTLSILGVIRSGFYEGNDITDSSNSFSKTCTSSF